MESKELSHKIITSEHLKNYFEDVHIIYLGEFDVYIDGVYIGRFHVYLEF